MKRTMIASALVVGLYAGTAAAADLPVGPAGTPWAPLIDTWTGFYIGVNAGGARSDNTVAYAQLGTFCQRLVHQYECDRRRAGGVQLADGLVRGRGGDRFGRTPLDCLLDVRAACRQCH